MKIMKRIFTKLKDYYYNKFHVLYNEVADTKWNVKFKIL